MQVGLVDVEEEEFLIRGGADAGDAKPVGDVGNGNELFPAGVADGGFDSQIKFAVLLGVDPNMVPVAVVLRHWGAVDKRRIQVFRF